MSRTKRILTSVLSLILVASYVRPAYAEFRLSDAIEEFGERRFLKPLPTRIKVGPVRVHPLLESKVTYDSNILLENRDAREDIVFNIKPGAIVELPFDKHQVSAGYQADFEIFSKSRDAKQNDQNQNFFALFDFHFPNWYVNILEKLSETSSRSGTTFTERVPRIQQSINPKIGYRWKRTIFEGGFRHLVRDYRRQANDNLDFQVVEWTGVVFYDLFARLKAVLEYQFGQMDYDDNYKRNANINQVRMGFEGELLPNVTAKVRTGMQFRDYEVSSEADYHSWIADVLFEYQVRKNVKLEAFFTREPVEATFGNVNYYLEHAVGGGVEYLFRPQWLVFTTFKFKRQNYAERATLGGQTQFRRDHPLSLDSGIRYDFRDWLSFELAYQFLYRQSNFDVFEYRDHQVSFGTTLAY